MIVYSSMAQTKPLTLVIDDELWHEFKSCVTKERTMNQAVVDLIQDYVNQIKNSKQT